MSIINATTESFESEVLSSDLPVLVDFWAPWCGYCKSLNPILDDLSSETDGKAKIVKINVDDESELAVKYGVTGIPALMVFNDGEVSSQAAGMQSKASLIKMLDV